MACILSGIMGEDVSESDTSSSSEMTHSVTFLHNFLNDWSFEYKKGVYHVNIGDKRLIQMADIMENCTKKKSNRLRFSCNTPRTQKLYPHVN